MRTIETRSGFTLIETAATLTVISLIAVGLIGISDYLLSRQQIERTNTRLNGLRRGINGNPLIVANEARTSFGYLGDMGSLPTSLQDLWVKGSQPAFIFNAAKKAGAGWNGPYLDISPTEFASTLSQDGWGNLLSYSTSSFVDPSFGATVLATLRSLGPDFTLGNSDDIAINFFQAELLSRVQGYVKDTNDTAVSGVGLTLNYPVNGALSSQVVFTDATGYYSVADIPFGNRSITIEPKLVLAPGTTVVSGGGNRNLSFTVKNYASSDVNVTSLTLAYAITPDAWFNQILVGGTMVYNSTNPRFGDGDTVTFTQKTLKGTGVTEESIPIRIQSPVTDAGDLIIGKVGAGGSLLIEFRNFNDAETGGGGNNEDVFGINFEVTFKNASNDVVGVVVVTP